MENRQRNRLFGFFMIIGMCLALAPNEGKKILHSIWCFLLLGYVWSFCIWKCITFNADMLTIEKVLYLMEYPGNMIIVALIIYNVICFDPSEKYKSRQMQLIQVIFDPDQSEAIHQFYARLNGKTIQILFIILTFHSLCLVVDMCYFNFNWVNTWASNSVHNLPALIISLNLMKFDSVMRFLCLSEEHLCCRLEDLRQSQRPSLGLNKLDSSYELSFSILVDAGGNSMFLLEEIRSASCQLNCLHGELVEKFGLILILNCGNSLISFCEELFSLFKFFEQPEWDEWLLFVYRLLWSIMHAERIWFILVANKRVLEQKCHLMMLLNQLEVCGSRMERLVNRFCLEIQAGLRQPLTACGIIDLDTLALGGFISAFMAIVIFLIQIELGNKSLMGFTLNRTHWSYI